MTTEPMTDDVLANVAEGLGASVKKRAPRPSRAAPAVKSDGFDDPAEPAALPERVWITLEENKAISPRGQFFGINGTGYILRPGKKAYVPRAIVDVLDNAVQMVPNVNPDTLQIDGWNEQLRFPYRLHSS